MPGWIAALARHPNRAKGGVNPKPLTTEWQVCCGSLVLRGFQHICVWFKQDELGMWDHTAMAYDFQFSGHPRLDFLSNNSWFVYGHWFLRSSVATAVLISWAKPRTHLPRHSSGVAQGTSLATIIWSLNTQVAFVVGSSEVNVVDCECHVLPQWYTEFAFCQFYGKRLAPRWATAITRAAAGSKSFQHLGSPAQLGMWPAAGWMALPDWRWRSVAPWQMKLVGWKYKSAASCFVFFFWILQFQLHFSTNWFGFHFRKQKNVWKIWAMHFEGILFGQQGHVNDGFQKCMFLVAFANTSCREGSFKAGWNTSSPIGWKSWKLKVDASTPFLKFYMGSGWKWWHFLGGEIPAFWKTMGFPQNFHILMWNSGSVCISVGTFMNRTPHGAGKTERNACLKAHPVFSHGDAKCWNCIFHKHFLSLSEIHT